MIDNKGNRHDTPPLESITLECIEYWTARMNERGTLHCELATQTWFGI